METAIRFNYTYSFDYSCGDYYSAIDSFSIVDHTYDIIINYIPDDICWVVYVIYKSDFKEIVPIYLFASSDESKLINKYIAYKILKKVSIPDKKIRINNSLFTIPFAKFTYRDDTIQAIITRPVSKRK